MDGVCLCASVWEMQALLGGKIDKVTQPEKDELILLIRSQSKNHRLLLSASASRCGAYLTEQKRQNPADAPMFCMLLRKRLYGGRIMAIEQPNMDRLVHIRIQARDEFDDPILYTLIAEIMGKHSNLVLLDQNEVIVDAAKHVGLGTSTRVILPGLAYTPPPPQEKRDARSATQAEILASLQAAPRMDKALSLTYYGHAPATAAALISRVTDKTEAAAMTAGEMQALAASLHAFYQALARGEFTPTLLLDAQGNALAVYPFLPCGQTTRTFTGLGEALDAYYALHERGDHLRHRGAALRKLLHNNIERCEKKLALYAQAIGAEESMERDRRYGELLTGSLHALKGNAEQAVVMDYYADPPAPVLIPMDKLLSPGANAQRYFRKYQKAKAARDMALTLQAQTAEELAYLEGQLDNLQKCTGENELSEIGEELREQGYIRADKARRKNTQKLPASKPLHYIASDGTDIYVGKNNRQNDLLTLKLAAGEDIWLHTKEIPGSHVILKSASPSPQALLEAAMLAAYYSRARGGVNVPVDYTPRKYVKKPSGAKPGMVIYTTNKTAYVTPDEALLRNLRTEA